MQHLAKPVVYPLFVNQKYQAFQSFSGPRGGFFFGDRPEQIRNICVQQGIHCTAQVFFQQNCAFLGLQIRDIGFRDPASDPFRAQKDAQRAGHVLFGRILCGSPDGRCHAGGEQQAF